MYKFIRLHFSNAEHIALILIVLTLVLIIWQSLGMNHTLTIAPYTGHQAWAEDDHSVEGNSVAKVTQEDSYHLNCQIANSAEYPYCHLMIPLVKALPSGLDLTVFEEFDITLYHRGGLSNKIAINLNHFYPINPDESDNANYKIHQYVVSTDARWGTYRVPLKDFVVPAWWAYFQDLPAHEYRPTLNNVKHFVVSTTSGQGLREEDIYVSRIEFYGKWISADIMHQALLWFWIFILILYLLVRAIRLNEEITTQIIEKKQLEKLNSMLDIRSKEFENMAKHDPLTGIYNRAGMHDILKYNMKQYQRSRVPFSIILLDIDNFKVINDTYGHSTGDTALRNLSKLISQRCRNNDSLARWGGEEFLLVCANTTVQEALTLSDDLRQKISSTILIEQQTITCSMGIAQFSGSDIDKLFELADEALYQAKTLGRNRVVSSDQ